MILHEIYKTLFTRYGDLNWWPAKTPYEVIVGAVLTQNTAWNNVEKAIENFSDNLTPEYVENASIETLIKIIRPSGFFNQKAVYLKAVTAWYKQYGYSAVTVQKYPLDRMRKELLTVKGVGYETADSILLYAYGYPTFVVDAYTKRLFERLNIDVKLDYNSIKTYVENEILPDTIVYSNLHALIVANAKEHCRKKPICNGCPLMGECEERRTRKSIMDRSEILKEVENDA